MMFAPLLLALASAIAQEPSTSSGVWTIDLSGSRMNPDEWAKLEAKGLTTLRIMVLPDGVPPLTIDPSTGVLPVSDRRGRIDFFVAEAAVSGAFTSAKLLNGTLTLDGAQYPWSASLSSSLWVCGGADHAPHHVVPTELVETYTREKGCASWSKLRRSEDVLPAPAPVPATPAVVPQVLPAQGP
jgi:hypothetical protein